MRHAIYATLTILPLSTAGAATQQSIGLTERWAEISGGARCTIQTLIQYSQDGSTRSFISESVEDQPSATYDIHRQKAARQALALIYLARQDMGDQENPAWQQPVRLVSKTKTSGVTVIEVTATFYDPRAVQLATIEAAFPKSVGQSLVIPGMTRLQIKTGINGSFVDIPVTDGKAVLEGDLSDQTQRIRYLITIGEGPEAQSVTYTQTGDRIDEPAILIEKRRDWFWIYFDEDPTAIEETFYLVTVTHTPGTDVILETSSDMEHWEIIDFDSWSNDGVLQTWVPERSSRAYFRAKTE